MDVPVVKSPLSIIALFVALIEAFLAYPVTQLQGLERMIMVVFMTSFPFFVAMGFFYILWHKPINLYNPGEIPSGLQDRYQPDIPKEIALEVKVREMQGQIHTLQESTSTVSSFGKGLGESVTATRTIVDKTIENDIKTIESQVRNRIQTNQNPDQSTIRNIKEEVEKERRDNKLRTINTIKKQITKYQKWLKTIQFQPIPDLKDILLEPASGIIFDPERDELSVGSALSDAYDVMFAAYTYSHWSKRPRIPEGTEEIGIVRGICEYLSCSFNDSSLFGAKLSVVNSGYPHHLDRPVNLDDIDTKDWEEISRVWSSAFWELRERYGSTTVDSAISSAFCSFKDKLTMTNTADVLVSRLVNSTHENSSEILDVFASRGIGNSPNEVRKSNRQKHDL